MVYGANGRNIRVRMARLTGPSMTAFWFDPRNGLWWRNGRYSPVQTPFLTGVPAGPEVPVHEFDPPGTAADGSDWALVLKRGE